MKVGDRIYDDLTDEICIILKLLPKHGVIIDSEYFDGYRYDWEVDIVE